MLSDEATAKMVENQVLMLEGIERILERLSLVEHHAELNTKAIAELAEAIREQATLFLSNFAAHHVRIDLTDNQIIWIKEIGLHLADNGAASYRGGIPLPE